MIPDELFWDTNDPYHYLRTYDSVDVCLHCFDMTIAYTFNHTYITCAGSHIHNLCRVSAFLSYHISNMKKGLHYCHSSYLQG